MKALTLLQPWASLVAVGAKKIETRSWSTRYRGPLAIHAAKRFRDYEQALCWGEPFCGALADAGLVVGHLPLGAVICTCQVIACLKVLKLEDGRAYLGWDLESTMVVPTDDKEYTFGDFTPGRYAWMLADVKPLGRPIPAQGQQRLWE